MEMVRMCTTSTTQYNIWALSYFWGVICIHMVKNMGQFTYSKCKVFGLMWFAYFSTRICGRCSTIELFSSSGSHKHSEHVPCEFWLVKGPFWGMKFGFLLCIPSLNCCNLNIQRVTHAHFPFKIAHLPCFKILRIRPILTSKLIHEKSTTNIEWKALITTLS